MSGGAVVIIGGGQGGYQLASSLRDQGYPDGIVLITDEPGLPYQHPPLSKAYLEGIGDEATLMLRPLSFYERNEISVVHGRAIQIERKSCRVLLDDGRWIEYGHLVFATGARARPLPAPGKGWHGVLSLRTRRDADTLRNEMAAAERIVVIGGGVIGLEFAAVAAKRGRAVTVVEPMERPMMRMVTPAISAYFTKLHESHGNSFLFGLGAVSIAGDDRGHARSVALTSGFQLEADLVVVGIGVIPNSEVAASAGLAVDNGILVDEYLLTSDSAISALGDCACYPSAYSDGLLRLESVQNAVDQARCVAMRLMGRPIPYTTLPWFWSEQFDAKLQVAGIVSSLDDTVVQHDPSGVGFSVFCFHDEKLIGVESVNRPGDHLAARRLLSTGRTLRRHDVMREEFDLKTTVKNLL